MSLRISRTTISSAFLSEANFAIDLVIFLELMEACLIAGTLSTQEYQWLMAIPFKPSRSAIIFIA